MKNLIKLAVTVSLACMGCDSHSWADAGAVGASADEATRSIPSAAPSAEKPKAEAKKKDDGPKKETRAIDLDAKLSVKRLVIAHGVKEREPVEPSESFTEGEAERIYAFIEVGNPDAVDSTVFVSFVPDKGPEGGPIQLDVGAAPRWRTWAYTRVATKPGSYHAVVRNARGEEIARTRFEIKPINPA
jgi:hypothetical protein